MACSLNKKSHKDRQGAYCTLAYDEHQAAITTNMNSDETLDRDRPKCDTELS